MGRRFLALGVVSAAALLGSTQAEPCGDKFLVVGRGMRYQRLRATHPASILIYANPGSRAPAALKALQLESNLKLAGHKPLAVDDTAALDDALRAGSYDLVVSDLADADALVLRAQSAASKPRIVPMLLNPTAQEQAEARNRFGLIIKAPGKSKELLKVIDDAMGTRLRAAKGR